MREYFSNSALDNIDREGGVEIECAVTGTKIKAHFSPYSGCSVKFTGGVFSAKELLIVGLDGDQLNEVTTLLIDGARFAANKTLEAEEGGPVAVRL